MPQPMFVVVRLTGSVVGLRQVSVYGPFPSGVDAEEWAQRLDGPGVSLIREVAAVTEEPLTAG